MTETTDNNSSRGWVFIDGDCPLCVSTTERLAPLFNRLGLDVATQQTPWVRERLGLQEGEPLTEVYVLSADGTLFGGADAVMYVARQIWWAWPLYLISRLPGAMFILSAIYRRIAANRSCISGVCHRRPRGTSESRPESADSREHREDQRPPST